jgi:hypothetical protein
MTLATAALNLALGSVYLAIGVMAAVDLRRGWKTLGFSHFGAAFMFLAFTCGPHHLIHGVHLALEGRTAGPLDMVAVLAGFPPGLVWFALRVEAFTGRGPGDRFVEGTPVWMSLVPTASAVYVSALAAAAGRGIGHIRMSELAVPNLLLLVIYPTIGYYLLRTQLRNHSITGGWSLSGFSLTAVFPTCSLMHAIFMLYAFTGLYGRDVHGLLIDWISVPAGLYFLWVVRALQRHGLKDWNRQVQAGRAVGAVAGP